MYQHLNLHDEIALGFFSFVQEYSEERRSIFPSDLAELSSLVCSTLGYTRFLSTFRMLDRLELLPMICFIFMGGWTRHQGSQSASLRWCPGQGWDPDPH
jgi:hypothetical protein